MPTTHKGDLHRIRLSSALLDTTLPEDAAFMVAAEAAGKGFIKQCLMMGWAEVTRTLNVARASSMSWETFCEMVGESSPREFQAMRVLFDAAAAAGDWGVRAASSAHASQLGAPTASEPPAVAPSDAHEHGSNDAHDAAELDEPAVASPPPAAPARPNPFAHMSEIAGL